MYQEKQVQNVATMIFIAENQEETILNFSLI